MAALTFKALIVDDDHDYADSIGEFLQLTTSWEVDTAYGVPEAIIKAGLHRPDAVLLDLEIPPESGLEVVAALERAFPRNVPAILGVSGNAVLVQAASKDNRFSGALLKPADLSLLVRWLAEVESKH